MHGGGAVLWQWCVCRGRDQDVERALCGVHGERGGQLLAVLCGESVRGLKKEGGGGGGGEFWSLPLLDLLVLTIRRIFEIQCGISVSYAAFYVQYSTTPRRPSPVGEAHAKVPSLF